MQANKPLLGSTQEKPHLRESNEGANALVAVEKKQQKRYFQEE